MGDILEVSENFGLSGSNSKDIGQNLQKLTMQPNFLTDLKNS